MKYSLILALVLPIMAQNSAKTFTVLPNGSIVWMDTEASPKKVGLKAPATVAADTTWVLPSADANGPLCSDGAKNLSFVCGPADFSQLSISRSGVTRVTLLAGSVGSGGLLRTYDAAGTTILNSLDQNGADLLSLKVNGTTAIDSSLAGTLYTLAIQRSGVNRITMLAGSVGSGGLFRLWNAAGDTILNSMDQNGADLLSLKINGSTFVNSSLDTTVHDLAITGTCTGCSAGAFPVVDSTDLVKNISDVTKKLRISAANVTTATTRTLSAQDANYTLAGLDIVQTFSASQNFDSGWSVTRSGSTTRVTALNGGASAGGIIRTWDAAGTSIINSLDQSGASFSGGKAVFDTDGVLTISGGAQLTSSPLKIHPTGDAAQIWMHDDTMSGVSGDWFPRVKSGSFDFMGNDYPSLLGSAVPKMSLSQTGALSFNGTTVIDASRNVIGVGLSGTSLSISGSTVLDSSRNLTVASCSGCLSALSSNITFSADNTYYIGDSTNAPSSVTSHALSVYRTSTDLRISMLAGGATGSGSISVYDYLGSVVNSISSSGISSTIGFVANGNTGVSATFDPNSCSSLTFTFGILTSKSGC